MTKLVRIPQRFYVDHFERDLPTPPVVKSTSLHYWIDLNHPATADLFDDAEFYSNEMDRGDHNCMMGIIRSAEATYNSIKSAMK